MFKRVYFICLTCDHRNHIDLGMPDFEQIWPETESLSDAINHHVRLGHEVEIRYDEQEDDD